MAVYGKVYVAVVGWKYEGETVLGVFNTPEKARTACSEHVGHDFEEVQVFKINGERQWDDPGESYLKTGA